MAPLHAGGHPTQEAAATHGKELLPAGGQAGGRLGRCGHLSNMYEST